MTKVFGTGEQGLESSASGETEAQDAELHM